MFKNRVISILLIALMALVPLQVWSADSGEAKEGISYVALGDSIAFGMGATKPANNYVNLIRKHLNKKYDKVSFNNLGIPGITSSQLLLQLAAPAEAAQLAEAYPDKDISKIAVAACNKTAEAVAGADIITISIGGNNLLGGLTDLYNGKFTTIQNNIKQFEADWPQILRTIRDANPDVKIYVMTLYNPFRKGDKYTSPVGEIDLYSLTNKYVQTINKSIANKSLISEYDYKVADAYKSFLAYKSNTKPLTHFYELNDDGTYKRDPHPTDKGYDTVFKLHRALLDK